MFGANDLKNKTQDWVDQKIIDSKQAQLILKHEQNAKRKTPMDWVARIAVRFFVVLLGFALLWVGLRSLIGFHIDYRLEVTSLVDSICDLIIVVGVAMT